VEQIGRRCLLIECDLTDEECCQHVVRQTLRVFGSIHILVNNAGVHYVDKSIEDISSEQLERTFQTNIISYFNLTKAALPYMRRKSVIINTASVTAYEPYDLAIDYAATKGAVVAFTRSLAESLVDRGIRVNAVAPGMTWTPLIPASIPAEDVVFFGRNRPMGRAAQPWEIAPSYVFLACESDSSYITGQTIIVS
jgi:NAD(P)-dependent dehydrogenase (short-subunit alcohol dehydrogenase family)